MTFLPSKRLALFLSVVATIVVACSPKSDPPLDDGVNDVKAACQVRASWTKPTETKCVACIAVAADADCGCEATKGFGGACVKQGDAKRAEPTCTQAITDCVSGCKNDCDCIDGCYANAPACKPLAAAVDGCVAKVCTQFCVEDAGANPG